MNRYDRIEQTDKQTERERDTATSKQPLRLKINRCLYQYVFDT